MASKWILAPIALAGFVLAAGCVAEVPTELDEDPAAEFGGTEWTDNGPPAGEGAESEDISMIEGALSGAPVFQLPFPCGQIWAGQTRTNHSPLNSVDFNRADDLGDAVVAAAAGTITRVGNEGNTSYGRWIEIDHGGGFRTRYAHLNSQIVSVGQNVTTGQKIGTLGNTGGSTGAHLHYELRKNGVAIKPIFNGQTAFFYGTRNYTSKNKCDGGGGSTSSSSSSSSSGGAGIVGTVNTNGTPLNVRDKPSTSGNVVGTVSDGQKVTITCQAYGSTVSGTYGSSALWDYIGNGYIADTYVSTGSDGQVAPTCK